MSGESDKPRVLINRLTPTDLPRILEIERACYSDPWSERLFLSELSNRPFNCALAARQSSTTGGPPLGERQRGHRHRVSMDPCPLVGFAIAHLLSVEVHILNLAIDPIHQGKGLGRALLYALLNLAAERGESRAVLEVRESNVRAQNLYRSAGFVLVGRRKNYYERQREDALVMALEPLLPVYPRFYRVDKELEVV